MSILVLTFANKRAVAWIPLSPMNAYLLNIRTNRSDASTGASDEYGLADQAGGVEDRHSATGESSVDDAFMYL